MKRVQVAHDVENDLLFVDLDGVRLESRAHIDDFYEAIVGFWRRRFAPRKMYWLVAYDGFSVNLRENDYYGAGMARAVGECAIASVRYGGDPLQRTAARTRHVKVHLPSHLYPSREEALEVVRRLRTGEIALATGS